MARSLLVAVAVGMFTVTNGASVLSLDDSTLDAAIQKHGRLLVSFCVPEKPACQQLSAVLQKLPAMMEARGLPGAVAEVNCQPSAGRHACLRARTETMPSLRVFGSGSMSAPPLSSDAESLLSALALADERGGIPFGPRLLQAAMDADEVQEAMGVEVLPSGDVTKASADEETEASADEETEPQSYVRELTDATFEHDTQAATGATTGPWLVEFYAPWCPHCKHFEGKYEKVARALARAQAPVTTAKVDATVHTTTARRFGVRSFPALRLMKGGRVWEYPADRPREVADIVRFALDGHRKLSSEPVPAEPSFLTELQAELQQAAKDAGNLVVGRPNAVALIAGAAFLAGMLCALLVALVTSWALPLHAPPVRAPPRRAAQGKSAANGKTADDKAAAADHHDE